MKTILNLKAKEVEADLIAISWYFSVDNGVTGRMHSQGVHLRLHTMLSI